MHLGLLSHKLDSVQSGDGGPGLVPGQGGPPVHTDAGDCGRHDNAKKLGGPSQPTGGRDGALVLMVCTRLKAETCCRACRHSSCGRSLGGLTLPCGGAAAPHAADPRLSTHDAADSNMKVEPRVVTLQHSNLLQAPCDAPDSCEHRLFVQSFGLHVL